MLSPPPPTFGKKIKISKNITQYSPNDNIEKNISINTACLGCNTVQMDGNSQTRLNLTFDLIYFENRRSDLNSSDIFPIRLFKLNKMIYDKVHFCPEITLIWVLNAFFVFLTTPTLLKPLGKKSLLGDP